MSEPGRVIVLKPCCIGDAVMALPTIEALHAALPDTRIDVWTGRHSRPIFEQHPAVQSVSAVPDIPRITDLPALLLRLRASDADAVLILDRSRMLDRVAHYSGIARVASVQRDGASDRHESDCYLDALRALGIAAPPQAPMLELSDAQRTLARARTASLGGRFVVLHPGGAENPGARMHTKRWPVEHWVEIVNWLADQGIAPVMTGSAAERGLGLEVAARSGAGIEGAVVLAGDLDLMESAAVAAQALAFVGPDTGMSHLAAATGVPTIAIFGPTNPARYAPRGRQATTLAPEASWSIPDADLRRADSPRDLPTTAKISPATVIDALQQMLTETLGVPA